MSATDWLLVGLLLAVVGGFLAVLSSGEPSDVGSYLLVGAIPVGLGGYLAARLQPELSD
ncbi:hypothetical protein [Halomarina litorea]|uniref:hypothetical protein n=1 Tax=Halomarina litorea TaxID=2961595 RepID=UPI0020C2AD10|nr:hypothetical protein [Halomarina sp. BCD28]